MVLPLAWGLVARSSAIATVISFLVLYGCVGIRYCLSKSTLSSVSVATKIANYGLAHGPRALWLSLGITIRDLRSVWFDLVLTNF